MMNRKRIFGVFITVLFLLSIMPLAIHASVPQQINYQGYLTDSGGSPVPDGDYVMSFVIYDVGTGGTPLWSEAQTVTVTKGIYNVILGQSPFPADLFDGDLYLGVTVGADAEMTPRQKLTSSAFAMKSEKTDDADTLDGMDSTQFSSTSHVHSFLQITGTASDPQIPNNITINYAASAGNADTVDGQHASAFAGTTHAHSGSDITSGTVADARIATSIARDSEIMSTVLANDGPGSGLNADYLDGLSSGSFLSTSNDYGRSGVASNLYEGTTSLTNKYVNQSGDTMSASSSGGVLTVTNSGTGYGVHGLGTGSGGSGVFGQGISNGVMGLGDSGVFGQGSSKGVWGKSTSATGYGVYGETSGATGYGVYGETTGNSGNGVRGISSGIYSRAVYGEATYTGPTTTHGGYFMANSVNGRGVFGGTTGATGYGVFGWATATGAGVKNFGGYFVAEGDDGYGIYAKGGSNGYAGVFRGNLLIKNLSTAANVLELGEGLDYAEGFDISEVIKVAPGSVLIIDPDNPGKLKLSDSPYDTKVAGIVAGAKGLGSGVRLGADQFDHDVALAGRVYCNVDTTYGEVSPGDLLTSSPNPGYAMKVKDSARAQGAILGKAMQRLEKGQKGQILVLVTLQ